MNKLWHKQSGDGLNPAVNKYMISKDLAADHALLPYDIKASCAHTEMLSKVGLISEEESQQIIAQLMKVLELFERGEFVLKQENEDVHTEIENFLIKQLGDTGKKIHVGRSRNDQVLVALRLLILDSLKKVQTSTCSLAQTVLLFAKEHEFLPMAGYTHLQHAMPSSVGLWAGAIVESLINDYYCLESTCSLLDQNPLGSAAGFGTSLPLDREMTTSLLGFSKTQINPLYCQNSRAKFDFAALSSLMQVMMTLGRLASDLILYTSSEFAFFSIDSSLTTGSSIMPQKRNLDIMEVLRANVAIVSSSGLQVQMAAQNLTSGYQKDVKVNKKAVLDAFTITLDSLQIMDLLFKGITPINENLLKPFSSPSIFAADVANELVTQGIPFRDAYKKVGESLHEIKAQDPLQNIKQKKHSGATGNLMLDTYQKTLDVLTDSFMKS